VLLHYRVVGDVKFTFYSVPPDQLSTRELLNLISFKTEGLLELHDEIPLPFTDPSEPGSFYFISEVSMRKLYAELLKTISYQSEFIPSSPHLQPL
jgi:hypothetical protein